MALIHLDFPSGQTGLYGTTVSYMGDGLYTDRSMSLVEDPDPNVTGNVLRFHQNESMRFVLPSAQNVVGIGGRFWFSSFEAVNAHKIMTFKNSAAANHIVIVADINGYIRVLRDATEIGASASPSVVPGAWQHIEAKALISDTVGTVEVRVEGVVAVNITGADTRNGGVDANVYSVGTSYDSNPSSVPFYIKDWILWNGSGTQNNDFLGSISVYELLTSSDVTFPWAASTGTTGWNLLDESPPNDDTDYIYAVDPAPAASKFGLTNLPADVTTVKGLYAVVRSKKTDGGDGSLQVGMVSGASTGLGSDRPITTAYTYWTDMFEVDPATAAAWLPSAVDAAQIQLDRTV